MEIPDVMAGSRPYIQVSLGDDEVLTVCSRGADGMRTGVRTGVLTGVLPEVLPEVLTGVLPGGLTGVLPGVR